MVCPACGNDSTGAFCSRCGAQISAPIAPAPTPYAAPYGAPAPLLIAPRVQRHVQTLGILWLVYAGYRLIGGLVGMFFLKAMSNFNSDSPWGMGAWSHGNEFNPHWMTALIPLVGAYTVITTALAFGVGFSLLTRKPWARTLAIVAAILSLIKPLLGTGLGIYTLWVLAPAASAAEYDAIADRT